MFDYNTALKFSNIELRQKQVYPYLPPGTSSVHTDDTYYLFNVNGVEVVIASTWIIATSVVETVGLNHNLRLNNISVQQLAVIKDQLRLLGVSFDIV
jgi:hypothetical protein